MEITLRKVDWFTSAILRIHVSPLKTKREPPGRFGEILRAEISHSQITNAMRIFSLLASYVKSRGGTILAMFSVLGEQAK